MAGGGPRKGAGRKKGGKNRATIEREERAILGIEDARSSGRLPLDIVLSVMRGGEDAKNITELQYRAAVDALPYVHARLSAATITHRDVLDELRVEHIRLLLAAIEHSPSIAGEATAGEIGTEDPGEPDRDVSSVH